MFLLIFESLGTSELLLIGVVALIFLGPRRLPEIARKAGKIMAEFRHAANEFRETWEREVNFEEEAKILREELNALRSENQDEGFSGAGKAETADSESPRPARDFSPSAPGNTIARPAISPVVRPADRSEFPAPPVNTSESAAQAGSNNGENNTGTAPAGTPNPPAGARKPEDKRNWL